MIILFFEKLILRLSSCCSVFLNFFIKKTLSSMTLMICKKNFISFWKKESHFLELIVWKYMKFDLTLLSDFVSMVKNRSKSVMVQLQEHWENVCFFRNAKELNYLLTDFFRNLTEMNLTIRFIDISRIIALANNQKAIFKMMDHRRLKSEMKALFSEFHSLL